MVTVGLRLLVNAAGAEGRRILATWTLMIEEWPPPHRGSSAAPAAAAAFGAAEAAGNLRSDCLHRSRVGDGSLAEKGAAADAALWKAAPGGLVKFGVAACTAVDAPCGQMSCPRWLALALWKAARVAALYRPCDCLHRSRQEVGTAAATAAAAAAEKVKRGAAADAVRWKAAPGGSMNLYGSEGPSGREFFIALRNPVDFELFMLAQNGGEVLSEKATRLVIESAEQAFTLFQLARRGTIDNFEDACEILIDIDVEIDHCETPDEIDAAFTNILYIVGKAVMQAMRDHPAQTCNFQPGYFSDEEDDGVELDPALWTVAPGGSMNTYGSEGPRHRSRSKSVAFDGGGMSGMFGGLEEMIKKVITEIIQKLIKDMMSDGGLLTGILKEANAGGGRRTQPVEKEEPRARSDSRGRKRSRSRSRSKGDKARSPSTTPLPPRPSAASSNVDGDGYQHSKAEQARARKREKLALNKGKAKVEEHKKEHNKTPKCFHLRAVDWNANVVKFDEWSDYIDEHADDVKAVVQCEDDEEAQIAVLMSKHVPNRSVRFMWSDKNGKLSAPTKVDESSDVAIRTFGFIDERSADVAPPQLKHMHEKVAKKNEAKSTKFIRFIADEKLVSNWSDFKSTPRIVTRLPCQYG
jgi:hypothetical protein